MATDDHTTALTVYYVMDPMCSWCWAFRPSWQALLSVIDRGVRVRYVMGGLAPDSDAPMERRMRDAISDTWRVIETRTGAPFNHDFWRINTPRRSTYPACRAAIAAGRMREGALDEMVEAIQRAYYLEALNPSLSSVLCDIAESIGLDRDAFSNRLESTEVRDEFAGDLRLTRRLGVQGFPTVVAAVAGSEAPRHALVSAGYIDPDGLLRGWERASRSLLPPPRQG